MIGIFHYSNSNNIVSLANAIDSITSNFIISDDLNRLLDCEKIILPGIGSMRNLKKSNIINLSKTLRKYNENGGIIYGICLGGQFIFNRNNESNSKTLNLIDGEIVPISNIVPFNLNVGFLKLEINKKTNKNLILKRILKNLNSNSKVYFLHKYYINCRDKKTNILFTNNKIIKIPALLYKKKKIITQFHPELSGETGLKFLENFVYL